MKTENLNYKDGDVNLNGLVAYDDAASSKRPGVVIMPDAFGIGPFVRERPSVSPNSDGSGWARTLTATP
jgi:dienelactone hydrolase